MSDVDRRIADLLDQLPGPDPQVTGSARTRALAAAGSSRRSRRMVTTGAIALAAACTGAALAAVSGLHLDRRTPAPSANRLILPDQVRGVAVVVDGRAWVRTRDGFAIEALRADAAELSPNATNVAIGIGRSLVALSPSGTTAWRLATPAPVTSIRWAPNPLPVYVAYVTASPDRRTLALVEADGDHARVVAQDVGTAPPAWNRDPLQLWYADRDNVWRTYAPATGARSVTKPLIDDPDAVAPELAARVLAVSGHGDWLATTSTRLDDNSTIVVISAPPAQDGSRAVELWWVGAGQTQRIFATTARSGGNVAISARSERTVK